MDLEFRDISKEEMEKAVNGNLGSMMPVEDRKIQKWLVERGLVKYVEWVDFWTAWNDCENTKQIYISENGVKMYYSKIHECPCWEDRTKVISGFVENLYFHAVFIRRKWRKAN